MRCWGGGPTGKCFPTAILSVLCCCRCGCRRRCRWLLLLLLLLYGRGRCIAKCSPPCLGSRRHSRPHRSRAAAGCRFCLRLFTERIPCRCCCCCCRGGCLGGLGRREVQQTGWARRSCSHAVGCRRRCRLGGRGSPAAVGEEDECGSQLQHRTVAQAIPRGNGGAQKGSSLTQKPHPAPRQCTPAAHPAVELTAEIERSRPELLPCTCRRGASLPSTSLSGRITGSWPWRGRQRERKVGVAVQ